MRRWVLTAFIGMGLGCAGDDSGGDGGMTVGMTFTTVGGTTPDDDDDDDDDDTVGDDDDDTVGDDDTAGDDDDDTVGDDDDDTVGDDDDDDDDMQPSGPVCQHQCAQPQDCFIDGEETGLGCNAGMCSILCNDDPTCVAAASGWTIVPCDSTADCADGGAVCVDTGGGVGGCSLQPSQGPCSDAGLVEMMATSIEGSAIMVCGQPEAMCTAFGGQNICIVGCLGNPCGGDLTCGDDGLCHCDFDTQCVDTGLGNNCNPNGLCEWACQQATDCPGHPFDGGTIACQQ